MRNLITDVPGLEVGHAQDERLGSGVTAVIFDAPAVGSIDLRGGGPGTRETALLDPAQTVEGIDAITLSGGSAFGLDAASGVQAWLKEQGRGFAVRTARVPIVPAAILFDLLSGGNKDWGRFPPYRELGLCGRRRRRPASFLAALARDGCHRGQLQRRRRLRFGADLGRLHDRGACHRQRRWQRSGRPRSVVLGGAVRAEWRIRRPRITAAVPPDALSRSSRAARAPIPLSCRGDRRHSHQSCRPSDWQSWRNLAFRGPSIRSTRRSMAMWCLPFPPGGGRSPTRSCD